MRNENDLSPCSKFPLLLYIFLDKRETLEEKILWQCIYLPISPPPPPPLPPVLRVLHHGFLSGSTGDLHLQPETPGGEEVQGAGTGEEEGEVHRETVQCGHHQGQWWRVCVTVCMYTCGVCSYLPCTWLKLLMCPPNTTTLQE